MLVCVLSLPTDDGGQAGASLKVREGECPILYGVRVKVKVTVLLCISEHEQGV
jgi:hypothetical protein